MVLIEICVDTPTGARTAAQGGAQRIELCAHLPCGGVTPSRGLMESVREVATVPVVALIRARAGGFVYDADELRAMAIDVGAAKDAQLDGVVIGCLLQNGELDRDGMARLIDSAEGLPVACHRAFDHCAHPQAAMDQLMDLGVARVLTSGQQPTATAGAAAIRSYIEHVGDGLVVLPGAGIRSSNVVDLIRATGCREVHASASRLQNASNTRRGSESDLASNGGPNVGADDGAIKVTDEIEVRALVTAAAHL